MELQVCQILLRRHLAPLLRHSVHAASTPWERGAPTATCFHIAENQVKVTLPEAQDERHWVLGWRGPVAVVAVWPEEWEALCWGHRQLCCQSQPGTRQCCLKKQIIKSDEVYYCHNFFFPF